MTSDVEEKAGKCQDFESEKLIGLASGITKDGKSFLRIARRIEHIKGAWAIKRNGRFYCFMMGKKPDCAGNDSDILEIVYQSAADGGKVTSETGIHYSCKIRNREVVQNG